MRAKKQVKWRYAFALGVIILGIFLEILGVGGEFLGFGSVGTWLIYVGFVMIAVITLSFFSGKKRIVDERMITLSYKATRITFVLLILGAFLIMIVDAIQPINIPFSMFMAYLISILLVIYFISYKIIEKYY